MGKIFLLSICVFTLILFTVNEARYTNADLRQKYERIIEDIVNDGEDYDYMRDGTSALVEVKKDDPYQHAVAKRGKVSTLGKFFKFTIGAGAVIGGASMLTSFARLGFDLYFQNNRECCGFTCCRSLCDDKIEFDRLKTALFDESAKVDAEWVLVQKEHNYLKNMDVLQKALKVEVDRFDKTVFQLVQTLTSKDMNELIDMVSAVGADIQKLNLTKTNISERAIDDIVYIKLFTRWETELFRWSALFGDAVTILFAVRSFRQFSVSTFKKNFFDGMYRSGQVYLSHVVTHGWSWKHQQIGRMKVVGSFLKNNYKQISTGVLATGFSALSVYSSVMDILYITQLIDQCDNLTKTVQQANRDMAPEVEKAKQLLLETKEVKTNISGIYNGVRDTLKSTAFMDFIEEVVQLAGNSSKAASYASYITSLLDFKARIATASKDDTEIDLIPKAINALSNITDKLVCLDRKFAILQSGVGLCKNTNNTMYEEKDIWPQVTAAEKAIYKQDNCIDNEYVSEAQFKSFIDLRMKELTLQTDCFLNSALAYGRVCTEWRKNISDAEILTNLKTDKISPIPTATSARVQFFVNKGCTLNSISANDRQLICANKATTLTKDMAKASYARWVASEVTATYDACDIADQSSLVTQICDYKSDYFNPKSLADTHAMKPLSHYSEAMIKITYDKCALTADHKADICYYKIEDSFTIEQIMDMIVLYYPRSMIEPVYNACIKEIVISDRDKRMICLLKSRGCGGGCALSASDYDKYRTQYDTASVAKVYNACSKKDSLFETLMDYISSLDK